MLCNKNPHWILSKLLLTKRRWRYAFKWVTLPIWNVSSRYQGTLFSIIFCVNCIMVWKAIEQIIQIEIINRKFKLCKTAYSEHSRIPVNSGNYALTIRFQPFLCSFTSWTGLSLNANAALRGTSHIFQYEKKLQNYTGFR